MQVTTLHSLLVAIGIDRAHTSREKPQQRLIDRDLSPLQLFGTDHSMQHMMREPETLPI